MTEAKRRADQMFLAEWGAKRHSVSSHLFSIIATDPLLYHSPSSTTPKLLRTCCQCLSVMVSPAHATQPPHHTTPHPSSVNLQCRVDEIAESYYWPLECHEVEAKLGRIPEEERRAGGRKGALRKPIPR